MYMFFPPPIQISRLSGIDFVYKIIDVNRLVSGHHFYILQVQRKMDAMYKFLLLLRSAC